MSESLGETFSHIYNTLVELERLSHQPRTADGALICGVREDDTNLVCGYDPHTFNTPHSFEIVAKRLEAISTGARSSDHLSICGQFNTSGPLLVCGIAPGHDGRHAWEPKRPVQPCCEYLSCLEPATFRVDDRWLRCTKHLYTFPGKFMAERLNDGDAE